MGVSTRKLVDGVPKLDAAEKRLKRSRNFDLVAYLDLPEYFKERRAAVEYLFRPREVVDWITLMPLHSVFSAVRDQMVWRTNLWMLPSLVILCMVGVFVFAEVVDYNIYKGYHSYPAFLIDMGGVSDTTSLLNALITSIVTSFGLVLSVIVVVLTGVLTLFGPRELRRFVRDREIQVSVGIIAGTVITGVLALLSVNSGSDTVAPYAPWLTTWVVTLFSFVSLFKMVYFIQYFAHIILVNNVFEGIAKDARSIIDEMYSTMGQANETAMAEPFGEEWCARRRGGTLPEVLVYPIFAHASGYVKYIRWRPIVHAARSADACVFVTKGSGRYVFRNSVVAYVQMRRERTLPGVDKVYKLDLAFRRHFRIGSRRTMVQDPEFAILQVLEIGLRAMSPAVNDPFTMLAAVDFMSGILCVLLRKGVYKHVHVDEYDGRTPRLVEKPPKWSRVCAAGMDPSRQVGPDSSTLMIRCLEALQNMAFHLYDVDQVHEVLRQGELVRETFLGKGPVSRDGEDLRRAFHRLVRTLQENRTLWAGYCAAHPEYTASSSSVP